MRKVVFAALVVLLGACGSSGPTTPNSSYPNIAGTYTGAESIHFINAVDSRSGSIGVTVTLSNANSSTGAFTGSYIFASNGGSGAIAGTERTDGGISISYFGDPSVSAAQNYAYLQSQFNWCTVAQLTSSGVSGSVANKQFSMGSTLSMPCFYNPGDVSYQTNITISIVANAP